MSENPYIVNETMELLGHQCYLAVLTEDVRKQMNDVVEARNHFSISVADIDMFMLGYIHGKRDERARKKVGQHNGKIY